MTFSTICHQARAALFVVGLIVGFAIISGLAAWGFHNRNAELRAEFEYQSILVSEAKLHKDCAGERAARIRLARLKTEIQYLSVAFPSRFFVDLTPVEMP
jgi:hypothetical protein